MQSRLWRDLLHSSCTRASCREGSHADMALRELRSYRNATHVLAPVTLQEEDPPRFLKGLAAEFPLLTSFHLTVSGNLRNLCHLSLFLSLKTDARELHPASSDEAFNKRDSATCRRYAEALEALDFAAQARLEKLTLDYDDLNFPSDALEGSCFPRNAVTADGPAGAPRQRRRPGSSPGAPWLASLPAFAGLQFRRNPRAPPLVLDSLGAAERDAISRLSQLASLELRWTPVFRRAAAAAAEGPLLSSPLLLTTALHQQHCQGDVIPHNARQLPLLEDLSLEATAAIQFGYFAFTPALRSLSLSLSRADPSGGAMWRVCGAHTRALRTLVLRSCRLLPLVGGLLALECHVALSLCCTCEGNHGETWRLLHLAAALIGLTAHSGAFVAGNHAMNSLPSICAASGAWGLGVRAQILGSGGHMFLRGLGPKTTP
eukprot:jgi/Mesen1/5087/ME000252S04204